MCIQKPYTLLLIYENSDKVIGVTIKAFSMTLAVWREIIWLQKYVEDICTAVEYYTELKKKPVIGVIEYKPHQYNNIKGSCSYIQKIQPNDLVKQNYFHNQLMMVRIYKITAKMEHVTWTSSVLYLPEKSDKWQFLYYLWTIASTKMKEIKCTN